MEPHSIHGQRARLGPQWALGLALTLLSSLLLASMASAQVGVLAQIFIDEEGVPGQPPVLSFPFGVATGGNGNVYVSGLDSHNVFEVAPGGTISEIIDVTGAGLGAALAGPSELAVDALGNVYVIGEASDNAFRITPGGTITEIIDPLGDGAGSFLDFPTDIVVDSNGDAYVSSRANSNVFHISAGGTVALVIDAAGAGAGAPLTFPDALAVDAQNNVYVAGHVSNNVLQRRPDGTITQIIGPSGDGMGNTMGSTDTLAVGPDGDVYVAAREASPGGAYSVWVWRVATGIVEKLPITSFFISHMIVDSSGGIFTTSSAGVDEYWPDGTFRRKRLDQLNSEALSFLGPWGLGVDADDALYVVGRFSNSGVRLEPAPEPGVVTSLLVGILALAHRRRPRPSMKS